MDLTNNHSNIGNKQMKYLITFQRHGCPEVETIFLHYVNDSYSELISKIELMSNLSFCKVECQE